MFKVGQLVYISESSRFFRQLSETDGEAGTIIGSFKSKDDDDDSEMWYRVVWKNGYKNSYQSWDLRHAIEQFTSNKAAAKTLLKEEY